MIEENIFKTFLEEGIDTENPCEYQTLLEDLQGGILNGHGRDFSVHLFLKFKDGKRDLVKKWIRNFALQYLKSAKRQAHEALLYQEDNIAFGLFANFFLSRIGYEYLEFQPSKIPHDMAFRYGMKDNNIGNLLSDPAIDTWEKGFQNEIHALVTIADINHNELLKTVNKIKVELSQIAEIVQEDDAFLLKNESGETIEHFGFIDGISQPLFLKRDIQQAQQESDFSQWDPRASLDIILVKDPNGRTDDSYGSYLVYRKLEQNVKGWNQNVKILADKLGISCDLARALIMGRFQDGTPVILSEKANNLLTNNFNFDLDTKATKCPFHSHIRTTNPRGDTGRVESSPGFEESLMVEKGHRIARRSMSYGEKELAKEPEQGSGMLFMCFQADISNQFNFIQAAWSNENHFVCRNVGQDPVIGQLTGSQKWPIKWGESETMDYNFQKWVKMKGGEYFFAPSISFLQTI
ncbi:Dyp-type peroxidase [Nostoc sp. C117]|uniref:Dyp-type peroxidase n=1 Tax=Nostoc sp. C117 TaxID=3349875 RepID=UPI00370DAD8A